MIGEEVILEIDHTLDQLIQNAATIQTVDMNDLTEIEIEAFQKTQESLLHHLMHMDQRLAGEKKLNAKSANIQIQEKRRKFEKMKSSYHKKMADTKRKMPILSKRKGKLLLTTSLQ